MEASAVQSGLSVLDAVYQTDYSPGPWGPGIRNEYIVHYILSGSGYYQCCGKTHHIHSGQCFVIWPGTLIYYYPDPQDPWSYAWINFRGAENLLKSSTISSENPVTAPCPGAGQLIQAAAENWSLRSAVGSCRATACLYALMASILEQHPTQDSSDSRQTIATRAAAYIRSNYRKHDLTVAAVARIIDTSTASLYRSFMKELQMSPKDYITEVRVKRAASLLRKSDFPIKSIAYSVGFSDQMYFSRIFKTKLGRSPSEYRAAKAPVYIPMGSDIP